MRELHIETKSESHTRAKSYKEIYKQYSLSLGFLLSMKNVDDNQTEKKTQTISLPLFTMNRLKEYLLLLLFRHSVILNLN